MPLIYDIKNKKRIQAEIIVAKNTLPLKKDGWAFNWKALAKEENTSTYILRQTSTTKQTIEGILKLKVYEGMLIMDVLEVAPHNRGSSNKKIDDVAGCLIAFACRESFKLKGNYKGFLTFTSKTQLIEWYKEKYGAKQTIGQRMYIDDKTGLQLIGHYLS